MVALWPSLLLHTTQLLRDPLFISAMLLLSWMTILCIRRELSLKTASTLVGSAVFAVLVILLCRTDVKEILTVVLLMAVAVCIITQVQQHRFRLRNVLGLLVIVTFTVLIPPLLPARNVSEHVVVRPIAQTTAARENSGFAFLESFARRVGALRHKFIVAYPLAGSNVDTNVELNSALDLLRYLPRAAELGFFAPFPRTWVTPGVQVGISGRLVAGLEMCVMYFMRWVSTFDSSAKSSLYSEQFKHETSVDYAKSFLEPWFVHANGSGIVDAALLTDIMTYLPNDLLVKVDIATMAVSLEARSPFLDHHLIEFAASLPEHLKLRRLTTKYLLKKVLRKLLPSENIDRPKMGFGVPIGHWFRGEMQPFLREVVLSEKALQRGYFKPEAVKQLIELHARGERDYSHQLWTLLMLELWFQRFID